MIYRTSIGLDVHARSIVAEANRRLSAAPPPRTGYRKTAPAHGNMGLGGLGT